MSPEILAQIGGALRALVPAVVAWMVGKGWIPGDSAAEVGAAIIAVGSATWSIQKNSKSAAIATVAAMPDVQKVVTTGAIANTGSLADNTKVVSK